MLEDTSFAIHPGKKNTVGDTHFHDIGNLVEAVEQQESYHFQCEQGVVSVRFYRKDIVRITMDPEGNPQENNDSRAVTTSPGKVSVGLKEEEAFLTLETEAMKVRINKQPFRITVLDHQSNVISAEDERGMGFQHSGEVIAHKKMDAADRFYGFGEKSGFLDKRGEKYTMWNTDVYAPHNPETDPLYESIPYFMVLNQGRAHGVFFDNTYKTTFDMKSEETHYSFSAEGGQLDYYLFVGPTPKDVLEQYTFITGRMPIPPKWAIGYHQSRYSYETEEEVRGLAKTFKEKGIPVDVIYLDIHYMDEYRVFTFDKERFPNPEGMVEDLKNQGIRIVPIVDPGVKKDSEYKIYQEGVREDHFCKYIEGDTYYGEVWPGISAFPDFTDEKSRKWWGDKHSFYTDLGIEGIWNDMNEPAVFNESKTMDPAVMHRNDGNPKTHRALHNIYGYMMGKATYEGMKEKLDGKRPFLLTRAGYAGVQRYASVWTGDNRSFWEHLQMSLPMVMNLGLSGVAFTGPDVGGFAHDTNGELLTRWTQVGAFTPYFRNHSAIGTLYQEPWQFGEKYEAIMKDFIQLRYKWMPQLYSLFQQASEKGLPVMRPLLMEYPDDPKTYQLNDQFMVGDNVVIAPILAPGITDRAVYLPEGEWVDYFSGKVLEGKRAHLVHAEIDELPIFVRKGTVLAHGNVVDSMVQTQEEITLHVFADTKGSYNFHFYDDDGETFRHEEGNCLTFTLELNYSEENVFIRTCEKHNNLGSYSHVNVEFHGLEEQKVVVNDQEVEFTGSEKRFELEI
ncbi:glycoside hydrolase family 31 protein [Thalassobacillus hwangdonensis]|uniref:Glycoside hydrolase family 31 protein n=1 Tax=Thalassobacillus hwangdonensis TaxID=546108 RepID=A0ABW3KXF7_9BACI